MAKIASKVQKIFGATGPTGILGEFGSLKAGAPAYSDDPDEIQNLAYGQGLGGAMINSAPPATQDFNSLFYLTSRQIAYFMQTGIAEWNSSTPYYIGSMVNDGSGNIYMSLTDANINQALTDSTKWLNLQSNTVITDIASDYVVQNNDYCLYFGTGATGFTMPTPSESLKGRRLIASLQGGQVNETMICTGTKWNYESLSIQL